MEARLARTDIEEEEDANPTVPKVLAITQGDGDPRREPVRTVLLDSKGRLRRTAVFAHLQEPKEEEQGIDDRQRRKAPAENPRADFLALVKEYQPDVIVVGGFNPSMLELRRNVRQIADQAENELAEEFEETSAEERALSQIDVISTYDDVARLYRHSQRAADEYPELNVTGRYCLALARYVQSPIQEFTALGDDISAIQIYEHQRLIPKETLLRQLRNCLVTIVNDVGVDINVALHDSYYQHMLQYVAGLGPRKAAALVRAVTTQLEGRAPNRISLLTQGILGPVVFQNAASFLRITADEGLDEEDQDDATKGTDVLDNTRIHPDDYRYARKIAADAIGKDEEDLEGTHPSAPCAELMQMEDRGAKLQVLDLDSYAQMLEEKHATRKREVLLQCSRELEAAYAEIRPPFKLPNHKDLLTMLTGETTTTIDLQLIVPVTIYKIWERTEPFPYLAVKLECGLEGSIHAPYAIAGWDPNLYPPSRDAPSRNLQLKERYHVGQSLNALIIDIKEEELRIELSADPSHMTEGDNVLRATPTDPRFFDLDKHEHAQRDRDARRSKQAGSGIRMIKHPLFHNVNAGKAEEMLANEPDGAVVIRPSASKGNDNLALTWRVHGGVYKHISKFGRVMTLLVARH